MGVTPSWAGSNMSGDFGEFTWDEFSEHIKKLEDEATGNRFSSIINDSLQDIAKDIIDTSSTGFYPVQTGMLKDSHSIRVKRNGSHDSTAEITDLVPYAEKVWGSNRTGVPRWYDKVVNKPSVRIRAERRLAEDISRLWFYKRSSVGNVKMNSAIFYPNSSRSKTAVSMRYKNNKKG